jgi:diguanylate cyclase (GGDEF)-like protein
VVIAATTHRRLLTITALIAFGAVFAAFLDFEVPGLGTGHFFYVPIALLALAYGIWGGALGGALATGLYALGTIISPRIPSSDIITLSTGIRCLTFTTLGLVIGWFAVSNRRLVDRLQDLAERDFLTGLVNTRVFDEALTRRCAAGEPFLLVLGDIDNLKEINDAHGHAEGNNVIRRLAASFSAHIGPEDQLARVGGDEFALLTTSEITGVGELCVRLRRKLEREGFEISFGWAAMPEDGTVPLELFRKADDRLYGAKLLRRNRRTVVALSAAANS